MFGLMKSSNTSFSCKLLSLLCRDQFPFCYRASSDLSRFYLSETLALSLLLRLLLPTAMLLFEALFFCPRMNYPVFCIRLSRIGETFVSLWFASLSFGADQLFAFPWIFVVEFSACIRRGEVDQAGLVICSIFDLMPLAHKLLTQTII